VAHHGAVGTLGVDQHLLEDGDGGERLELAEDVGELVLEEGRVVLEAWAELGLQQKGSANSPSAMMAITSSPPTALSMKRARKRSWRRAAARVEEGGAEGRELLGGDGDAGHCVVSLSFGWVDEMRCSFFVARLSFGRDWAGRAGMEGGTSGGRTTET
jgi:hypothetical protein